MGEPSAPRSQKRRQEDDLEAIFKRKFQVKCRFRAVGRMVMSNIKWLDEDDSEDFESSDVRKTVAKAIRRKTKRKQLLTLNVVKEKLASVTYFRYWGPGRVIVRQGHEAHALYFLVSGEVGVSLHVYDELLKEDTTLDVGLMTAGDMFGEVSLLHDINRTATCTTNTDVEVLVLMKEDFKNILQATVEQEWNAVKRAMSKFSYFDALDEVGRREACLVAKMHSYLPSETILGDGAGIPNFVYFVLSGQCRIIEALQIIISKSSSQKTLYSLYTPKEEVVEEVEQYNYERIFKMRLTQSAAQQSGSSLVLTGVNSDAASEQMTIDTSAVTRDESPIGKKTSAEVAVDEVESSLLSIVMRHYQSNSEDAFIENVHSSFMEPAIQDTATPPIEIKSSLVVLDSKEKILKGVSGNIKTNGSKNIKKSGSENMKTSVSDTMKISGSENMKTGGSSVLKTSFQEPSRRGTWSSSVEEGTTPHDSTQGLDVRTYFMQVCLMNPGSCFGLGENMKRRRIVAVDAVNCLLLPRVWLFQRNTANIWSRIVHYLDRKVPSTKALFDEFVMGRRWDEFKTQIVDDIVETGRAVNWTTIHDVPYSIRIEEDIDI